MSATMKTMTMMREKRTQGAVDRASGAWRSVNEKSAAASVALAAGLVNQNGANSAEIEKLIEPLVQLGVRGEIFETCATDADRAAKETLFNAHRSSVARAYLILGFMRQKSEMLADCVSAYETALCIDPTLIDARKNILPALAALGRYQDAELHAELLAMLIPEDADAHFSVGVVMMRSNKLERAVESYARAIATRPGFKEAHINIDACLLKLGRIDDCRRFAGEAAKACSGFWTSEMQRPPHFVSGLRASPWHEASRFTWVKRLEAAWTHIQREGMSAMASAMGGASGMPSQWGKVGGRARHDGSLVANGEWRELVLFGGGGAGGDGRRQCPFTANILADIPEIVHAAMCGVGEALFSVLAPGTHLRAHCGSTNTRLTAHLGVRVPKGCRIRCGNDERTWEEGKCIVFDDSFEHEVWHEGDSPRLVLLINFWHPDYDRNRWGPIQVESNYQVQ